MLYSWAAPSAGAGRKLAYAVPLDLALAAHDNLLGFLAAHEFENMADEAEPTPPEIRHYWRELVLPLLTEQNLLPNGLCQHRCPYRVYHMYDGNAPQVKMP